MGPTHLTKIKGWPPWWNQRVSIGGPNPQSNVGALPLMGHRHWWDRPPKSKYSSTAISGVDHPTTNQAASA